MQSNQPAQLERLLVRLMGGHDDLFGHTHRVAEMAVELGTSIGLDRERLDRLYLAARLHDVGKLEIDQRILAKRRSLKPTERSEIHRHPGLGYDMVDGLVHPDVAEAIRHHHERWDGAGYPDRLAGSSIPMAARIILVVDAFDAMTSDRCYQPPIAASDAIEEILRNRASQFDPLIAEMFVQRIMTAGLAHAHKSQSAIRVPARLNGSDALIA